MLDILFMQILDMTKLASIVILLVLLARLMLKKTPKVFSYALWGIVLLRLLCPVSLESPFSIIPEWEPVADRYTLADAPISPVGAGTAAVQAVGDAVNGGLGIQTIPTTMPDGAGGVQTVTSLWWEVWVLFGQYIWLFGVLVMVAYAVWSYVKIKRSLLTASPLRDNIFLVDEIPSPFVMGLVKPKIYLPSSMDEGEQGYILLHEQYHIRRGDHLIKALAFAALCIHWFNPLVWAAFVLASKDMEMSCDEAVVKRLGSGVLADYTASLLSLATGRRIIAGMPLAFGEGNTKGRIRNLANWKKPAFWVVVLAVIACTVLTVCLATNPAGQEPYDDDIEQYRTPYIGDVSKVVAIAQRLPYPEGYEYASVALQTDGAPYEFRVYLKGNGGLNETDFSPAGELALDLIGNTEYVAFYSAEQNTLIAAFGDTENYGKDRVIDLKVGATYVSYQCRFMNPLSSYGDMSDSGYTYTVHDDCLEIVHRASGAQQLINVSSWEWQEFPYTDDEWAELYKPSADRPRNPSELYDEILYLPISQSRFFLRADGDLRIVELASNPQMGTYLWSIYSLVPDGTVDVEQLPFDREDVVIATEGIELLAPEKDEKIYDLEEAIHNAILTHYASDKPDGLIHVESHIILANEAGSLLGSLFGKKDEVTTETVYLMVYQMKYSAMDGVLERQGGSNVPTAITFERDVDGAYTMKEYWEPRDGSYYVEDIRAKFPWSVAGDAIDTQKYVESLQKETFQKAQAIYAATGGVERRITDLLTEICSSPSVSSNPEDYLAAHQEEYEELISIGEYTLRYCFAEFLKGGQADLRGHIMADVCQQIAVNWGEPPMTWNGFGPSTGQEYFESFLFLARQLAEENTAEDMEKYYPASWLLLQMTKN